MLYTGSRSPGIFLKWMISFTAMLEDIAPQFSLPETEISNLRLASQELTALLDSVKLNKSLHQIAVAERNAFVKNALSSSISFVSGVKTSPNWTEDCNSALQINMLPEKANFDEKIRKKKNVNASYSNEDYVQIMTWLKMLSGLINAGIFFWLSATDVSDLQVAIEKADAAFNVYKTVYTRQRSILTETNKLVRNTVIRFRAIVKRLKATEGWTDYHTELLDVNFVLIPKDVTNFKPMARVKIQPTHVGVYFLKDSVNGMNVYSRLQGEVDFSFLGYAKRSPYKDPRSITPQMIQIREYYLIAVVTGKETGVPSDIVSVQTGGRRNFKPVAWATIVDGSVRINFRKRGKKAMNIYTRKKGEIAFTFLGRTTNTSFIDPRPIINDEYEVREYKANAVQLRSNKEIGIPCDIMSIRVGSL